MLDAAVLIPLFPLAGFATLVLLGRRLGDPLAGWVATGAMGGAFISACVTFAGLLEVDGHDRHHIQTLFTWIDTGSLRVDASLLVDPLSITMALFVTGVGALIHLYSVGYMHGDPNYSKFFVYLNLFAFSMLMLVLGSNMLISFLGWEGVGACSYLLISFWFERKTAATAGKKAFVTNRIGDVGFLLAMFLVFQTVGSLDFADLNGATLAAGTATAIALLLFLGACGKSAQLPLYVWLPDAMEGPTPVSALIHAATMVTAGVYLMARTAPVLAQAPDAGTVVAVVGALTALVAATIACAQNDIKKVLAYSTISQLGFMFLAVGSGNYVAAVFHMVTHAFFKALLFLGAGSVIHGLHHEQDMKRMGALRKFMPVTAVTFIIGWLAIAGIPPFAGFWSKDDILLAAFHKSPVLWAIGLVTALLTAYYMTRQVILVFFGDERWRHASHQDHVEDAEEAQHAPEEAALGNAAPHESPWVMTGPLVVLAVLAVLGGALNLPFGHRFEVLHNFLHPSFGEALVENDSSGALIFTLAAVAVVASLGGLFAARNWWSASSNRPELEPRILQRAYAADELVDAIVVRPSRAAADAAATVDTRAIDGAVDGVAALAQAGGQRLRVAQTGYVRNYALLIAAGTVATLAWVVFRTVG
ncbi:MAG TPA: NADH-quinone oxidoreductase subunit L [Acidimicrobiales bacterium]|nr:NADH-quinone oxidoreductase subunit L [Acidimicrobiales bacterium]